MNHARAIHVCGSGIVPLAAAIAFKRALPDAAITLDHRGAGSDFNLAGPELTEFNRKVGIAPDMFARATGAHAVHNTCFADWGPEGESFSVPVHAQEKFVDGIACHALWLRCMAAQTGDVPPLADLLADRGARSAVRFDPSAYLGLLRQLADHLKIGCAETAAEGDGLIIECDSRDTGWTDWSASVPAVVHCSTGAPDETTDEMLIRDGGTFTLRSGAYTARLEITENGAGHALKPWQENSLRIGSAALAVPPLYGLPLSAALADILRAIRFLPAQAADPALEAEYNRQSAAYHAYLLEWAAAPFVLRQPSGTLPGGLENVRARFAERGRLVLRENDPIARARWIALLAGLGIRPERIDPVALEPDLTKAVRMLGAPGANL